MLEEKLQELNRDKETYLVLRVRPQADTTMIGERLADGSYKISVAAVPEKGRANQAIIAFLACQFAVPKSAVRIISGQADRKKLVKISTISDEKSQK